METIIEFLKANFYKKIQRSSDGKYLYAESTLGVQVTFRENKSGSIQLSIDTEVIVSADANFIINALKNLC